MPYAGLFTVTVYVDKVEEPVKLKPLLPQTPEAPSPLVVTTALSFSATGTSIKKALPLANVPVNAMDSGFPLMPPMKPSAVLS
jgi:hypothetical protein